MKKNIKKILSLSSYWALFLFLILMGIFEKNKSIFIIIILVGIFYFIIRTVYRFYILKDGKKIHIINDSNVDCSEDQTLWADFFGDILGIIMYLFLMIEKLHHNFHLQKSSISLILICCLVYFTFAHFSIKKNWVLMKSITVLTSTIQGVMALLILFSIVSEYMFFMFKQQHAINIVSTINEIVIAEIIIMITFLLESSVFFTLVPMVVSIVLFILYILLTPIYQLGKLKLAFQVVNIIMVFIGIIAFFFSGYYMDFINLNKNLILKSDMYAELIRIANDGATYFNNFGIINIKNLFYLAVLPYTFGIIIANMCMDFRLKYANKKKNEVLHILMVSEYLSEEEILYFRKKYLYYGGNQLDFNAYEYIFIRNKIYN